MENACCSEMPSRSRNCDTHSAGARLGRRCAETGPAWRLRLENANGTETPRCYGAALRQGKLNPAEEVRDEYTMATFPHVERRLYAREFVLKEATIVTGDASIRCSIRNQHEHGAELRVGAQVELPDGFTLIVPDDDAVYRAVVRWRRNERVGVQVYSNSKKR